MLRLMFVSPTDICGLKSVRSPLSVTDYFHAKDAEWSQRIQRRPLRHQDRPLQGKRRRKMTAHTSSEFEEWPLDNVRLQRIMVNNRATFQLQFGWDLCATHCNCDQLSKKTGKQGTYTNRNERKGQYTDEVDDWLVRLKSDPCLSWKEIHQRHTGRFPGRSRAAPQVRCCNELKGRAWR